MEEQISQEGYPTLDEVQPTQETLFTLADYTITSEQSFQQLKDEQKELQQQLKALYMESPTYVEKQEEIKHIKKDIQTVKQSIEKQEEVATLLNTLKGVKETIKERKEQISFSALEYAKASGQTQIEKDGFVWDIVRIAKLVRRSF